MKRYEISSAEDFQKIFAYVEKDLSQTQDSTHINSVFHATLQNCTSLPKRVLKYVENEGIKLSESKGTTVLTLSERIKIAVQGVFLYIYTAMLSFIRYFLYEDSQKKFAGQVRENSPMVPLFFLR